MQRHGPNKLVESKGRPWGGILIDQFRSALVALLFAAALVSLLLGEFIDAAAILVILLLNAGLGFFQEYRAEKALAALRQFDVPTVRVSRDAALTEIPADQLVPGDVCHVLAGALVPADGRVLECVALRSQEATLTGESVDVDKHSEPIDSGATSLGDRTNMVYKGATITSGHGVVLVTATGMETELGKIAESIQTVEHEPTPLQRRLGRLGRTLAMVSLVVVAVVFGIGVGSGEPLRLMLMTSLSLAVAIVPEGLPAVATVALAIGAMRMYRQNTLIRRLPAVETLGSVTVICTDKTGTLTQNQMTVALVDAGGQRIDLTQQETPPQQGGSAALDALTITACLCNNAELDHSPRGAEPTAVGAPTEAALAVMAARCGWSKPELLKTFPLEGELPFDSARKRMTTLHGVQLGARVESSVPEFLYQAASVALMKGGADAVLDRCTHELIEDSTRPLTDSRRGELALSLDHLAADGYRLLGFAARGFSHAPDASCPDDIENQMALLGFVGLVDPPRPETPDAIEKCRIAGIRPIMITGDHPLTARHIALAVGMDAPDRPTTGAELSAMTDAELSDRSREESVFARVAPRDKLRIVDALQEQGEVVAMTGDGVNDSPALKKAHIGVAMGRSGADVSKEASDMVLLDDNFATIVSAIEQGRIVYDNIRKFVKYTMTSNAGEVLVMAAGPVLGMPLPLLPLQILWVNLVTDGLPGLALAFEPQERATMRRPPHNPQARLIDKPMWRDILWVGALMGAVSLAAGYWLGAPASDDASHWRTIVFTVLTLSQMGNVLALRSSRDSLFRIGLLSNKPLLGAVLLTLLMQLAVIYARPLQVVFGTAPLSLRELAYCLVISTAVFWAIEAKKLVR